MTLASSPTSTMMGTGSAGAALAAVWQAASCRIAELAFPAISTISLVHRRDI